MRKASMFIVATTLWVTAATASAAEVFVQVAPPPPVSTAVFGVAPGPQYVWMPGYHRWDGRRYVWVAGRWVVPPRRGMVWVAPHWAPRGGGYVFVAGHWR